MNNGIILYGPPASGKDTIADLLAQHPGYEKFRLLRTGAAKPESYRHIDLSALDERTDLLWRNDKYDTTYAIDQAGIEDVLSRANPIVQLGEVAAVEALQSLNTEWVVVSLWCDRHEAKKRLIFRGSIDIDDRLKAWDETESVMSNVDYRTDHFSPEEIIDSLLTWVRQER